jgi:hypothetical protein
MARRFGAAEGAKKMTLMLSKRLFEKSRNERF